MEQKIRFGCNRKIDEKKDHTGCNREKSLS